MPTTVTGSGDAWRELRGEHFVVRSTTGPKDLAAVACDIGRVDAALRHLYPSFGAGRYTDSSAPAASVIAVDDERGLRELLSQFWERHGAKPLGAYWSGPYGHHIVLRIDVPARERFRRILHEYAHFATHVEFGDAPPWLDEGLSELWTNAAVEGDRIEIGRPVSGHLKLLREESGWIPMQELTTAKALPPSADRKRLARFYAESWALVHYLVFETNAGRLDLKGAARDLPSDKTVREYVGQSRLRTVTLQIPRVAHDTTCTGTAERDLAPVEAFIRQAQALADGERPAAALPMLRRAAALEPDNPQVTEITGVVRFLVNEPIEAAAIFDRLIAAGTASHLSYYYRAILADVPTGRLNEGKPIPVDDYLRRAISLAPGFAPARERLASLANARK